MNTVEIITLYFNQNKSIYEIASLANTYPSKIRRVIKKAGLQLRARVGAKKGILNHKWSGHEEICGSIWNSIKQGAKYRGVKVKVEIDHIWKLYLLQNKRCAMTGLEITFPKNNTEFVKGLYTCSLDRIDSSKDYEEGNLQWVHKIVNIMKMDLSIEEFIKFCKLITEYNYEYEQIHHL